MKRFIGHYFTWSRGERNGLVVLLILFLLLIAARCLLPHFRDSKPVDFSSFALEIEEFQKSILQDGLMADQGAQRYPAEGEQPVQHGQAAGQPALICLNASDSTGLRRVRGIGPVLSKRIVKYRWLLGGFVCKEQLLDVYGIDRDNYELIAPQVSVDKELIRHIRLNQSTYRELSRHPYLDDFQCRAILSFRRLNGSFTHAGQLLEEQLLTEETYSRIKEYISLE